MLRSSTSMQVHIVPVLNKAFKQASFFCSFFRPIQKPLANSIAAIEVMWQLDLVQKYRFEVMNHCLTFNSREHLYN